MVLDIKKKKLIILHNEQMMSINMFDVLYLLRFKTLMIN